MCRAALASLLLLVIAPALQASDWDGGLQLESRSFVQHARWPGQTDDHNDLSLAMQLDYLGRWPSQAWSLQATIFGRIDEQDSSRSHADVRELNLRYSGEYLTVNAGIRQLFWGSVEAVHLVDVVNQSDWLESPDGQQKLGQPAISVSHSFEQGTLELFALPYFREREYPDSQGRLRPFIPVDAAQARYESDEGNRHVDYAARASININDLDFSLSYFRGTKREPRFDFEYSGVGIQFSGCSLLEPGCSILPSYRPSDPRLVPIYDQMEQYGVELLYTAEQWIFKAEAVHQHSIPQSFWAAAAGLEYNLGAVSSSAWDWTLLLEYYRDSRGTLSPGSPQGMAISTLASNGTFRLEQLPELRDLQILSYSPFQDDVFFGGRLALNDTASTEALAGVFIDTQTGAKMSIVKGGRRLGERWRLTLEATAYFDVPVLDPLYNFKQDSYVRLQLTRYF
eukprot:TRINITY_DN25547_c0_g1_i1.p1 TRINITY_DN25547_c0_g1~~TRINITY_DN25547_c0_g1_i1.p1  ORF type:complete len:453 (-),score=31.48 TRINITY_DN25547_c0_g1_i1:125-1483(-)